MAAGAVTSGRRISKVDFPAHSRAAGSDFAAVHVHEPAYNRQAYSQSALGPIQRSLALHEQVEHPRQHLGGYPDAIVLHADNGAV